jgi:hypothetical protein
MSCGDGSSGGCSDAWPGSGPGGPGVEDSAGAGEGARGRRSGCSDGRGRRSRGALGGPVLDQGVRHQQSGLGGRHGPLAEELAPGLGQGFRVPGILLVEELHVPGVLLVEKGFAHDSVSVALYRLSRTNIQATELSDRGQAATRIRGVGRGYREAMKIIVADALVMRVIPEPWGGGLPVSGPWPKGKPLSPGPSAEKRAAGEPAERQAGHPGIPLEGT